VQRQALVGYLQTIQTAFLEVDDALISVQKSREQLAAEGQRVAALAEYARLAKLRYDEGYASYIEVLDAQRSLFDAELQYVAVQSDVYASLIDTYRAMGGGWVIEAQHSADEVDFPAPSEETRMPLEFPSRTQPVGVHSVK
jgi:multidrug efflux system outer membrane protein